MATYLLFDFPDYYPGGGIGDLREAFLAQSDAEAIEYAERALRAAAANGRAGGPYENRELVCVEDGSAREVDANLDALRLYEAA